MTTNANAPARQRLTMRQRTLALIVAVLASAGPAIAQEGPSFAVEPAWSGLQQPRADWSRVRKLAAATEVVVTVKGSQPGRRYFVLADESDLTVLNLTDPTLPPAARRVLLAMTLNQREFFTAHKGAFVDAEVRVSPDGVFVDNRKVADLQHIIETRARKDVVEMKTRHKGRGVWGHLGPLGGYFVGAMSGGVVAGLACQAVRGRDRCDTGPFLTGALVGGIAGGVYGFRAANRETENVIYYAP